MYPFKRGSSREFQVSQGLSEGIGRQQILDRLHARCIVMVLKRSSLLQNCLPGLTQHR